MLVFACFFPFTLLFRDTILHGVNDEDMKREILASRARMSDMKVHFLAILSVSLVIFFICSMLDGGLLLFFFLCLLLVKFEGKVGYRLYHVLFSCIGLCREMEASPSCY